MTMIKKAIKAQSCPTSCNSHSYIANAIDIEGPHIIWPLPVNVWQLCMLMSLFGLIFLVSA